MADYIRTHPYACPPTLPGFPSLLFAMINSLSHDLHLCLCTMRVELIGHSKPCVTEIYLYI